ncbi:UNKNOWN [Stylonychia lemnae]|uniref:Cupin-like domain-containing protein n=1 Tax=Stylonychia lemnae TaxID=5949 RepID=A0A077ZWS8_STYLE|nr:UNKNOWN [Stylonychia lemnae]|eukprot:CDW72951.1 UNKNOWN [Stylonychia lemnae]
MISLFELKNKGVFKIFIRIPFYIKNIFLLVSLIMIQAVIYIVYFRKDGLSVQNITKVLKGLNSETFNYLEAHSDSLRLTKLLNNYQLQITSNHFMDECLRINKPCKFEGLALEWGASKNWQFGEEGYDYLIDKFGDQQVNVYESKADEQDVRLSQTYFDSFKSGKEKLMTYKEFVQKMSTSQNDLNLREGDFKTYDKLKDDVENPSFMKDINNFYKVELIQGTQYVQQPKYDKDEQILCQVDGVLQIKLIPHVYRQELYTGKDRVIMDTEAEKKVVIRVDKLNEQCSPVNFFEPDDESYPLFQDIDKKYTVLLHEGDCLYIPAFYYYQFIAKTQQQPEAKGLKPSSISVSLKYHGNSVLLDTFMRAIEQKILT